MNVTEEVTNIQSLMWWSSIFLDNDGWLKVTQMWCYIFGKKVKVNICSN